MRNPDNSIQNSSYTYSAYTATETRDASHHIDSIIIDLAKQFRAWWNEQKSLNYDLTYYEQILASFAVKFVPAIYHYSRTCEAGDLPVIQANPTSTLLGRRTSDFIHLMMSNDRFHEQLRLAISLSGKAALEFSENYHIYDRVSGNSHTDGGGRPHFKKICFRGVTRLLHMFGRSPRTLVYCSPARDRDLFWLSVRSMFKIWNGLVLESPCLPEFPNIELRISLSDSLRRTCDVQAASAQARAAKAVFDLFPHHVPISLLEGLQTRQVYAQELCDRWTPERIITGYGFLGGGTFPFFAAECGSRGTEIFGWQHGGMYGESEPGRCERVERRLSDHFISWGWKDGDERVLPTACPLQYLFKKRWELTTDKPAILWITTADSRFTHFIDHAPVGDRMCGYFEHQQRVYTALDHEVRRRIVVRLYKEDYGWGLRDQWRRIDPEIRFSRREKSIIEEVAEYGVVVIDHGGSTSLLECIACDMPTIVVCEKRFFPIRESAKPYYRQLQEAGIFHTSARTFARELSLAVADPKQWHAAPKRRRALAQFKNNFLRGNGKFVAEWQRLFLDM